MHQSEWDVVLVQETHWKGDTKCYTSGPWHVVATGAQKGDTSSGVAIFVHRRLANADCLSYRVYAQGRVLHVRVPAVNNSVDVICVYQHVWRGSCNTEQNVQQRHKIWLAMRQAVASVPLRNDFITGGDYNTPIYTLHPHTGTAILHSQSEYPDQDEVHSVLQDHGLTLLNTWHAKNKVTCINSGSRTQLDYLVCRVQHADLQAKHCQPLRDCALGTWKENHHIPVGASVRKLQPWTLPPKRPQTAKSQEVQTAIAHNSPAALAMKASIAQHLQAIPDNLDLQQLHHVLTAVLQDSLAAFFPRQGSTSDERVSACPQFQQPVRKMWELYRAFKTSRSTSLGGCFTAWEKYTAFRKTSVQVKQAANVVKRAYRPRRNEGTSERYIRKSKSSLHGDHGSILCGSEARMVPCWTLRVSYKQLLSTVAQSSVRQLIRPRYMPYNRISRGSQQGSTKPTVV